MLTIREDRDSSQQRKHHGDFDAVIRLAHEKMLRDKTREEEINSEPSDQQTWDEMVFENRNREYGAYAVRKGYYGNVVTGLIATLIAVVLVILYPTLAKMFGQDTAREQTPPRKLVYTELSAPPPIDKPKPPPPQVQLPRLQRVIKFVPPKIVREEIIQLPPTIQEIKENEVGAVGVDGPTEVVFDEPVTEIVVEDNEVFTVVDQQPEFEGGYEAMMAFIQKNMIYP